MSKGDDRAVSALYDRYGSALYGICVRILGDQVKAQDAVQEGFVKAWKNAGSYDPSKGKLFTWLLNICRNTALNMLRDEKQFVKQSIQEVSNRVYNPEDGIGTPDPGIKKYLEQLDPKYRELIDLIYFGGHTQREVAEFTDIPLGTVKTRVRTALSQLRELLKTSLPVWVLVLTAIAIIYEYLT